MTTWTRERMHRRCGQCGRDIPAGEVLLCLAFDTFKKYRCADCAGPAPPDLPAVVEPCEPPPIDLTRLGLLPLDFSKRG